MKPTERGLWIAAAPLVLASCLKPNPEFIGATGEGATTGEATAGTSGTPITDSGDDSPSTGMADDASTTMAPEPGCAPNLESIRLTVFTPTCTEGCHSGDMPSANLDLTTVDLFADLLDIPSTTCLTWSRVVASAPEQSILYAKVAGLATCEVDRPVEHEPLGRDELECISSWIESIEDCERCGGTECIDLTIDPTHCGSCEIVCPDGIPCVGGSCDCPGDGITCSGACVDPLMDGMHCGGCDKDCQGAACEAGECQCVGLTDCGSCVDTATDSDHCGGCDQPCGVGETCQSSACACSDVAVSLATDVQPIFTANCVDSNCHGGLNPKKDLLLEAGASFSNLVNVLAVECNDGRFRVEPGAPENSYLMHKLLGVQICSGVQMPQSGGPGNDAITDAELDAIAAWICQGAADN